MRKFAWLRALVACAALALVPSLAHASADAIRPDFTGSHCSSRERAQITDAARVASATAPWLARRTIHVRCRTDRRYEIFGVVGYWEEERATIHLWTKRLAEYAPGISLRHVATHEFMHALGGRHICVSEEDTAHRDAGDCSPVGYGPGILNPIVNGREQPTPLDLAEMRRHRSER